MRTIVDLPEEQIKALDILTKEMSVSRAEIVRRAIKVYLEQQQNKVGVEEAFGLLKASPIDATGLQCRLRDEW